MYLDITKEIERELHKIEQILEFTKGTGLLITIGSNSRSTAWHDSEINQRGKTLEEYIISKNLYIMKAERDFTTFQNKRRSSYVDLNIVNN